jgi:hypothetical protein
MYIGYKSIDFYVCVLAGSMHTLALVHTDTFCSDPPQIQNIYIYQNVHIHIARTRASMYTVDTNIRHTYILHQVNLKLDTHV